MSDKYLFITPIANFNMPENRYKLLQIGSVFFVSFDRLNIYKRKFGLTSSITKMSLLTEFGDDFFKKSSVFALVHHSGDFTDKEYEYIIKVQNAIQILCLLERGYSKRRFTSIPAILGMNVIKHYKYMFINKLKPNSLPGWRLISNPHALNYTSDMITYHKEGYFFKLLRILNKHPSINISTEWYKCIFDASVLLGKSWSEKNVPEAFLYNMIALETLLTMSGDTFTKVLPNRIKAFIGWVGYWKEEEFESKIDIMYKKRCKIVHEGKFDLVSVDDLLFVDDLVNNVFDNIVNHIKLFHSKEDLILFSEKVEAEHLLGIKGKTQPKTLRFSHRSYTDSDKLEIF